MAVEPRPSRPNLPPGYGIDKATGPAGERLPWKRVTEWLDIARNYWVCTARPNGRVHVKPVWALWLDGELIFSTHPKTVTAVNLRSNPQVTIHLESGDEVVILEGIARRIHDRKFLTRFGRLYEAKYDWPIEPGDVDPDNPDAAFFAVRPRTALTWASATEVGESITRWSFADADR